MKDYPCGKFSDCSFSRFGSVMQTYTHTQTHWQKRMNAILQPAWVNMQQAYIEELNYASFIHVNVHANILT